jgi:hypothetical protein
VSTAALALDAVVDLLTSDGIDATRDPGAQYPAPYAVVVGLPSLVSSTLAARVYQVPVYVVAGVPLVDVDTVDGLYELADRVASTLNETTYRPHDYRGTANADPLPAVVLDATVTVPIPLPVEA